LTVSFSRNQLLTALLNSDSKLKLAGVCRKFPLVPLSSNINGLKKNGDELTGLSCFTIVDAGLGFLRVKI